MLCLVMKIPKLYHGSAANIKTFIPRDGVNAGGAAYFGILATDIKRMAQLYALKIKEGFDPDHIESILGSTKTEYGTDPADFMLTCQVLNGTPCAIFRDRKKFLSALEKNGGGYVYTLPTETFSAVKTPKGEATTEWLSPSATVTPTGKERVSLNDVMHAGCQVLFLKDGMGWDTFLKDIAMPHRTEFDASEKQIALFKKLIADGTLINENASQRFGDPIGLGHWTARIARNYSSITPQTRG